MAPHGNVPQYSVDTTALPTDARVDVWREALSMLFDIEPDQDVSAGGFRGTLTAYHLGPVLLGQTQSEPQRFRRTAGVIGRSAADHYMIQLQCEGGYGAETRRDTFEVGPGDVCIFDLSRPIETATTEFGNLSLVVPRKILAPLLARPDDMHGCVLPAASSVTGVLADHVRSLRKQAPHMRVDEANALAVATVRLVAACAGGNQANHDELALGMSEAVLMRIRRHIDDNLGSPALSPHSLTRAFGLSRASLYRLFEPLGGVAGFIREQRLLRAFRLISRGRARISEVALALGFENETVFGRVFKQRFGMTPREARVMIDESHLAHDPNLGRWLRGLV